MNLILLFDSDFITKSHVRLTDRRLTHIHTVLKSKPGDKVTVGLLNGEMGQGIIEKITEKSVDLTIELNKKSPEPVPLTLIIPMIRPPMFKRLLFHATTLGIKKIYVVNFNRVEKSLWSSSSLKPEEIQDQLILGLEQSKDTVMPTVEIHKGFKQFITDHLPAMTKGKLNIVAHPGGNALKTSSHKETNLIIGPEGGLIPYELEQLQSLGFTTIDLGPRILRVDTALPLLMGKLY